MPDDAKPGLPSPTGAGAGAPARRWRASVTAALVWSTGTLVLLSVLIVVFVQVSVSRKNTSELLRDVTGLLVEYMETSIRSHLDAALHQVDFIGQRIESGEYDLADRPQLTDLLTGAVAGTPQIDAILTWDRDLRQFGVWRDRSGQSGLLIDDESADPDMQEAAEEIKNVQGPYWGELVFRAGATRINLRRPLRRQGEYIGFMVASITVQELSDLAAEIGDLLESTAFVLYGREAVLAHPNLTSSHPEQSAEAPAVLLTRVGDPVLEEIWSAEPLDILDATEFNIQTLGVEIAGEDYAFVFRELTDYGATPLYIGAWLKPQEDNVVDRLINSLIWSGLLLVLALVAAVVLGRLIARPIRRLAEDSSRIGHLELDQVGTLAPSRLRELDDQARAFNTMLASLRSFETYVPRRLVTRLIRAGGESGVTSEERELTILFTDIAGFTSLSENIPAAEVAAFLNHHFALLGACVEAEDGTVDKFIGDALMAFWGAPEPQSDTATRACRAALAMAAAVAADNEARAAEGKPRIQVRIGIHTGPVVVGNIGWPGRINYTIVGDSVNASQRLEVLGKDMTGSDDVVILISGATAQRLDDSFKTDFAGRFEVRGKSAMLEVYRLRA